MLEFSGESLCLKLVRATVGSKIKGKADRMRTRTDVACAGSFVFRTGRAAAQTANAKPATDGTGVPVFAIVWQMVGTCGSSGQC